MTVETSSTAGSEVQSGGRAKILVIGNSHTQAIKEAIAIRAGSGKPVEDDIEVCWVKLGGKGNFGDISREEAMAKVRGLGVSDLLVTCLIGTLNNMIGLFNHESPFSLAVDDTGAGGMLPHAKMIPQAVMRDVFREHVEGNEFFQQMADAAGCLVVHFVPPPPKEAFARGGKSRIVDGVAVQLEYAPKRSRLALWKLEEQLVANYLARLKVYHYSVPLHATTPEGFLSPVYHANDATHANAAFGELLLQDFERMLHGVARAP